MKIVFRYLNNKIHTCGVIEDEHNEVYKDLASEGMVQNKFDVKEVSPEQLTLEEVEWVLNTERVITNADVMKALPPELKLQPDLTLIVCKHCDFCTLSKDLYLRLAKTLILDKMNNGR